MLGGHVGIGVAAKEIGQNCFDWPLIPLRVPVLTKETRNRCAHQNNLTYFTIKMEMFMKQNMKQSKDLVKGYTFLQNSIRENVL